MNDGVKILLARMETHPEEFVGNNVYSKWNQMFVNCEDSLDPEDVKAYKNARKVLIQQHFTEQVMEELLAPHEPEEAKQTTLNLTQRYGQAIANAAMNTPQLLPSSNRVEVNRKPITKFGKLYTP
jgi:hypothetical protein